MDERFPKYLRWLSKKLGFFAVPNLGAIVAGLAVLAFLAKMLWDTPFERFAFDPIRVLDGEWWRLFPFPISAHEEMLWFLIKVFYIYWVMGALESAWGAAPLTLFVFFGYLAAVGGAFFTGQPISIWTYILENVSLAFGTLFPDLEIYIYFILPVKAKWLALLAGGFLTFQFIVGGFYTKIFLLIVLSPYLLFFSPVLFHSIKSRLAIRRHRQRFDRDMWK